MNIFVLAAAAAASVPAPAPLVPPVIEAVPAKPADPAAMNSARQLIKLMHFDQTLDQMMGTLIPTMGKGVVAQIEQDNSDSLIQQIKTTPGGREGLERIFDEEMLKSMRSRYPEILEAAAREYASAFTSAELDRIIVFYQSGPGAKWVQLSPQLQQSIGPIAGAIGRQAGIEAGTRMMERAAKELVSTKNTSS
ncbi:DUF2059 domain-containing protein [Sphingomonas crusticola]|uniref:DUF2059 domain-containing protein n=1 Tax=Sphingomonas crusticola TaxID=1697973 RepID=UPI0013C2D499|nr:DUF2059 domain-containing protein [Sphingomonas crusticola]